MIIQSETGDMRYARESEWHEVFAWFPVRIDDLRLAWLQTIQRRALPVSLDGDGGMVYEYRLPK